MTMKNFESDFFKDHNKKRKSFMGKAIAIYMGLMLLLGLCVMFIIRSVGNEVENTREDMGSHMGDTVVVNGDSLTVVDYSSIMGTYTLSNGTEVAKELVEGE